MSQNYDIKIFLQVSRETSANNEDRTVHMCGSTMKTVMKIYIEVGMSQKISMDFFFSTEIKVMKRFSLEREWEN